MLSFAMMGSNMLGIFFMTHFGRAIASLRPVRVNILIRFNLRLFFSKKLRYWVPQPMQQGKRSQQ